MDFKFEATVNLDNAEEVKVLNAFIADIHVARNKAQNDRMARNLAAVDDIIADAVKEAAEAQNTPEPTPPEKKKAPVKETPPTAKQEVEQPEQPTPAAEAAEEEAPKDQPAEEQQAPMSITLEDVREAIRAKTQADKGHANTLRTKLAEYGAANASGLPADKYEEFYKFVTSL